MTRPLTLAALVLAIGCVTTGPEAKRLCRQRLAWSRTWDDSADVLRAPVVDNRRYRDVLCSDVVAPPTTTTTR
jgi:hypothetical protein